MQAAHGYAGGQGAGATEAPRDDPGAGRVHRAVTGRGQLCPARHARVGGDRGARARRGRRARVRGGPDRPRAARRRHRGGRAAGGQPGGLLEPGAGARGGARAVRRRPQHAGGGRRRRADARARAGRAARGPPRGRPDRPAGRAVERRLGADRARTSPRSRSATRCPASWPSARSSSTTTAAWRRRSATSARSATGGWRCCRGRSRPRPGAPPSAPSRRWRPRSGSTAASCPAPTR